MTFEHNGQDVAPSSLNRAADFLLGLGDYHLSSSVLGSLRRSLATRWRAELRSPVDPEPIPELSLLEAHADLIRSVFFDFRRPVVLRGALSNSAAVDVWETEYLRSKCGSNEYEVTVCPEGRKRESNRDVKLERRTMASFCDALDQGTRHLELELCSQIFTDVPKLLQDLGAEELLRTTGLSERFEFAAFQLFMQPEGACTDLHAAFGGNLFLNVRGRKRWVFIDPRYTALLSARPKPVLDSPLKPFFHLDCELSFDHGDPELERIPRYEVVLHEGDALLNPPWWWHAVFSEADLNIAVASRMAVRWWDPRFYRDPNLRNQFAYSLASVYYPVRLLVGANKLGRIVSRRPPKPTHQIMAELFADP
ncbi:MAG: cupin-like domain-containing protein [Myxococcota bacterium]